MSVAGHRAGRVEPEDQGRSQEFAEARWSSLPQAQARMGALAAPWRGLERVQLHADLTILTKLSCALSKATAEQDTQAFCAAA